MRRGLILLVILLVVGGFALATTAKPDRVKIKGKVAVCHLDSVDAAGTEFRHVIVIGAPAVDAHLRNHGDCVVDEAAFPKGSPCDCAVVAP